MKNTVPTPFTLLTGWLFGAGALTYSVELYGGLLVFAAYVIYDTQGESRKAPNDC
jgi:hypothetical protein